MNLTYDSETGLLVAGVIAVLILASLIGWILARRPGNDDYRATIANLNARTRAWWLMVAIFLLAMLSEGIGSVILFGLTSFLALREFITMTPTKHGDHGTLLWLFFVITPIQASDVLQYIWGKALGKHKIAPAVSPNKTWEGFLGGVATATLLGTALWWATPFTPWQAAGMSFAITLMGFAGGLVMSAIKRDRGVKDYGTLIKGHGGVMDRIDSLCFSAPVFFHLTRYFFT